MCSCTLIFNKLEGSTKYKVPSFFKTSNDFKINCVKESCLEKNSPYNFFNFSFSSFLYFIPQGGFPIIMSKHSPLLFSRKFLLKIFISSYLISSSKQ